MILLPNFPAFEANYHQGKAQLLWVKLMADLETPVGAMLKLADQRPYSFLLESIEGGRSRGRYSAIGLKPDLIWRCKGKKAEINRQAMQAGSSYSIEKTDSLHSLKSLLEECHLDIPPELPPMSAGLFGYLGYENVRLMEKLPEAKIDFLDIPDGIFIRPTLMVIFDHVEDSLFIVTTIWPEEGSNAQNSYNRAAERIHDVVLDLGRHLPQPTALQDAALPSMTSNVRPEQFHEMIHKAKEYIAAGDIFQVVLSQRFSCSFPLPAFDLYRSLRRVNPSPFLFFFQFDNFAVTGSSPEILVRLRDGMVTIRPIAGTRPRGKNAQEDRLLAQDLLADPKETAEHLMLLDLGRNDIGRVAEIGSVLVTEKMVIENYSHVMHITSNVDGMLKSSLGPLEALAAGFPAGTVSGAPKIRAMEIIDELEPDRRGVYGGAVGYFSANGNMDHCIALRTAVVKNGVMYVQAGAGIVADSKAEAENQECQHKARALFRAAEDALRRSGNR